MGSFRVRDLTGMVPPGHSRPIGTLPRRPRVTATVSFLNESGEVEFGEDEVEIEAEFGYLQLPPQTPGGEDRVWIGFQVQTEDKTLRNATLVLATYPYSTDWFDWSDFKPVLKRSREQRLEPLRAPMEEIKRMLRERRSAANDLIETRSGWLTARLSWPTRTVGLSITSRARSKRKKGIWRSVQSSLNRRHRHKNGPPELWCFGACREFEKCREILRHSLRAQHLFDSVGSGTLFEGRRSLGRAPFLPVGDMAKSLHSAILESSIIKALAGDSPHLERIKRSGKPPLASLLMKRIYEETLYNLVRRLNEPGTIVDDQGADGPEEFEEVFDELVQSSRQRYRTQGFTEIHRHKIDHLLTTGSDSERILACAALVGASKAGHRVHRIFHKPVQAIWQDRSESPEVRKAARASLDSMRRDDPPGRNN